MTTDSVLDILIYLFDRYMLDETPSVPLREQLAHDLEQAGFGRPNVERALDWLTDLAFAHQREAPGSRAGTALAGSALASGEPALRIFSDGELVRLSSDCRGLLLRLERAGVLSARQRELVIERLLALDADEPDVEQLKWVLLMVLSSEPGAQLAVERLGGLMAQLRTHAPH